MIYLIIKNEKRIKEVKDIIKKKNVNSRNIVYSLNENKRNLSKEDIVICDSIDSQKEMQFAEAKIIMYKPTKRNIKLVDENIKVDIIKTQEELDEKLEYIIKRNNYAKKLNNSIFSIISLLIIIFALIIIYLINVNKDVNVDKTGVVDFTRENIVLFGDSITNYYDVKKFFGDLPVINSGIGGDGVDNLYEQINERVYAYNPTKVFILIGTNDIAQHAKDDEYIYNKIKDIIKLINKNRPEAEIYLESVYPVNRKNGNDVANRTNERIKGLNKKISKLCLKEDVKCEYINLYDDLLDKNGDLKPTYTKDGLHLSDKGYEVVTNKLMKYINPNLIKKVEKK